MTARPGAVSDPPGRPPTHRGDAARPSRAADVADATGDRPKVVLDTPGGAVSTLRAMARRVRAAALLCAVGLLLTGCAGTTAGSGTVAGRDLTQTSPLAEFLGTPVRSPHGLPQLDERERRRQDRHTELVAECMREAGFAYVVVPVAERLGPELLAAYETDPDEFARRYGYGVTTIEVAPFTDPNQEIRQALPEERRAAYDRALFGAGGSDHDSCHRRATVAVYGDPSAREDGFVSFADLLERINDLNHRIDTDPRLQQAYRDWARCLADAGYPGFAAPPDARRSVFDRLPAARLSPAGTAGSTQLDPAQVAEVRAYELALAPVDRQCQRRYVDGPRRAVTLELERAFIAEHRAELERYREFLAED